MIYIDCEVYGNICKATVVVIRKWRKTSCGEVSARPLLAWCHQAIKQNSQLRGTPDGRYLQVV